MSNTSKAKTIAVLPGDGIGIDVTLEAVNVFAALNLPLTLHFGDIGWAFWCRDGDPIPQKTWELIKQCDVTLLGAVTSMPELEALQALPKALQKKGLRYVSPIIQLRQQLDLYINLRPCFNLTGKKDFNFVIIRENTEGLYAGLDYHPPPKTLHELLSTHPKWGQYDNDTLSVTLRIQSEKGLLRLFQYAFEYADKHHFKRVTLADKPNVLRSSGAFARTIFESVACRYPHIQADILNVDAVALWLIKKPEAFGVIVTENMFGDILSDLGAGVMGGLGLAPSANIGSQGAYFEPVHGSGPKVKRGCANPSAMFFTCAMLLDYIGYHEAAVKIRTAATTVIQESRFVTYDLGGSASTHDMAQAILDTVIQ